MSGLEASDVIRALLISLGLTLALEGVFGLLWGLRDKWELTLLCLVNLLTNPLVVLLHSVGQALLPALWGPLSIMVLEAAAMAAEGWYYARYSAIRRPYLFSLCANGFSYGFGLILNALL